MLAWREDVMGMMRRWHLVVCSLLLCLQASGCVDGEPPEQEGTPSVDENPFDGDASAAMRGSFHYETQCISCHGPTGGPGSAYKGDLRVRKDAYTDRELFMKIANGGDGTGMPGFSMTFDEDEIWQLVTHIRLDLNPE